MPCSPTIHYLFENQTALAQEFASFEQKIRQLAQRMHINLMDYQIDHLAIRVNSEEKAKYWLTELLKCGRILSDNVVNGRPIYLIELAQPLTLAQQSIGIIELPFPKTKIYPQESWEHIEIVMPFLTDETTQNWINRIMQKFLWETDKQLKVKISEPQVAGEQLPNPSIAVSFADKSENHTCIKIHPYHIKKIIQV